VNLSLEKRPLLKDYWLERLCGDSIMLTDIKGALKVKSYVSAFMREHVYQGDYERPRVKPDAAGAYHYRDRRIQISCAPSPREGWINCAVIVQIVRRRFPFRRLEMVLSTGYGVDVYTYRPGKWIDYVVSLGEGVEEIEHQRAGLRRLQEEEEQARRMDDNFSPVDDASLFEKW